MTDIESRIKQALANGPVPTYEIADRITIMYRPSGHDIRAAIDALRDRGEIRTYRDDHGDLYLALC